MSHSASVAYYTCPFSLSARQTQTNAATTDDGDRVLDGSAHLKSRALVCQSASVTCCTLSVCVCVFVFHPSTYVLVTLAFVQSFSVVSRCTLICASTVPQDQQRVQDHQKHVWKLRIQTVVAYLAVFGTNAACDVFKNIYLLTVQLFTDNTRRLFVRC
jgi:hypothetical protein